MIKTLVTQHILSLGIGYDRRINHQLFVLNTVLGFTPGQLSKMTNVPERTLRRYINGERNPPIDLVDQLNYLLIRCKKRLFKLRQHTPRNQREKMLQTLVIDLAAYCDVVSLVNVDKQSETSRERYRAKVSAGDEGDARRWRRIRHVRRRA